MSEMFKNSREWQILLDVYNPHPAWNIQVKVILEEVTGLQIPTKMGNLCQICLFEIKADLCDLNPLPDNKF